MFGIDDAAVLPLKDPVFNIPKPRSDRARDSRVDRERLNLGVVSELQASGNRLARMRGYIEWLQPVIPHLQRELPER